MCRLAHRPGGQLPQHVLPHRRRLKAEQSAPQAGSGVGAYAATAGSSAAARLLLAALLVALLAEMKEIILLSALRAARAGERGGGCQASMAVGQWRFGEAESLELCHQLLGCISPVPHTACPPSSPDRGRTQRAPQRAQRWSLPHPSPPSNQTKRSIPT